MLYQKIIFSVQSSTKLMVFISSLGMLVSACGEKKKSKPQSSTSDLCAEEKVSTSKTAKKSTTSKKDEEVDDAEVEEEKEVKPTKSTKTTKLAFNLQNTGTATSTSTTTGGVTYEKDIKPFWVASCVAGCHTSKGTTFPPLETWAEISAGAAASVTSTKTSKMPIGTASLTAAQKQLLLDWETGGFLQGPPPSTGATGTQTATNTSVSNGIAKETPAEEVDEEEGEEVEAPKTVKKASKATATKADNCVDTKKAATNTKKATSKTTTTKAKKSTAKDEEE